MARPRKPIDPRQVEALATIQCTYVEMAKVLGCDDKTLKRRFGDLIDKAREGGKTSLRRYQWKNAQNGNCGMQVWLGKQYLGQTDRIDATSKGERTGEGFILVVPDNGRNGNSNGNTPTDPD